ncbi:MAG: CotH kinase family protein [Clostridia bacterium]|nr:CotH kinase family protein [Clostridia bacterium]
MKRYIGLLLLVGITLSLLCGCNPSAGPEGPGGSGIEAGDIIISEVMPDNEKVTLGHTLEWIELYSRQEGLVDLSPYALTDDLSNPNAYPLRGLTIADGEYRTVVLPEDASFHLASAGETVYLTCDGKEVARLTYPESTKGQSFSPDGVCDYPTPGQANTKEGYIAYLESMTLPALALTEGLSSGTGHDWVEVTNTSDKALDLSQYTLTDKRKEPTRYSFPAVTLEAGQSFVVYCSGDSSLGKDHASFKLSSQGETVYLLNEGKFTDVLTLPLDLAKNESYGRVGKQYRYFASPTPGAANGEGYELTVFAPQADLPSGVYESAVTVSLSGSGTIYYTLDGSRPTTESAVYTAPISVDKITTIRTFCSDSTRTSDVTAYTYLIGVSHDLPIVSVSLPQEKLNGENEGVLNHIDKNYEYEAQLTLIENGTESFSLPFGFRLHGNDSRKGAKQNFQVRFRSEYGAGELNYPLFENRTFDTYDSLLLKGGSEDWANAVLRDELSTALVDGTTALYAQAIKPVVLYLGGEYWGIYYLRERFSDDYVASHLDVSADNVDLLYSSGGYVQKGSAKDFTALKNYVSSHDMTTDEAYGYLCSQIDVQSLMDWYICRTYLGDRDLANIRRFRSTDGDGKWRWMFFDLDWSFYTKDNPVTWTMNNNGGDAVLMRGILKHPQGKDAFLKRYAELMGTILNEAYINQRLDSLVSAIESEIPRDRERWGRSVTSWENALKTIRNYVKDGKRDDLVKSDLKQYFGLSDQEMESYFGA